MTTLHYPYSSPANATGDAAIATATYVDRRRQLAQAIVKMAERMDESSYQAGRCMYQEPQTAFYKHHAASIRQRLALLRLVTALAELQV